jgi:hypothetical protein
MNMGRFADTAWEKKPCSKMHMDSAGASDEDTGQASWNSGRHALSYHGWGRPTAVLAEWLPSEEESVCHAA